MNVENVCWELGDEVVVQDLYIVCEYDEVDLGFL